jgi:hypothetical protein
VVVVQVGAGSQRISHRISQHHAEDEGDTFDQDQGKTISLIKADDYERKQLEGGGKPSAFIVNLSGRCARPPPFQRLSNAPPTLGCGSVPACVPGMVCLGGVAL